MFRKTSYWILVQKHYLQDCNSQTYKISIYYIWRLKYYKGSTHRSAYIWLKWQSTMLHNPEKSAKSLWNYFSQKKLKKSIMRQILKLKISEISSNVQFWSNYKLMWLPKKLRFFRILKQHFLKWQWYIKSFFSDKWL